jgi:hypothetical protein
MDKETTMALTFSRRRQRKLSIPKLLALAAVALVLLLGSNAFSETKKRKPILLEAEQINFAVIEGGDYYLETVCVDDYKFLVTKLFQSYKKLTILSTIQFYEERDGKAVPAKCPEYAD